MVKLNAIKRQDFLLLALVLLIAAVLRLGEPGTVEFFHDEAMLSMLAQDMAYGATFPTVGIISSVGIPNSPVSVYIMALPYKLSDDPLLATLYVALLNVIGVGLLWWIAHRYFSPTVGLIASLTYAVSPWAVLYSRKIWAQDFLTPFLLLAFALGLAGFVERRRWAQILCLPVLLFACQIHFAAWALLPVYGALVWLSWRGHFTSGDEKSSDSVEGTRQVTPAERVRTAGLAIILTLLLSALVLTPFAIGILQTLQQDPTRISAALTRSEASQGLGLSGESLKYTLYLATGLGVETWVAPNQQADLLTQVPVLPTLWLLVGIAALAGLLAIFWRYRRLALFVMAWALLPLIVFTPTWTTVYPHYFIGAIPAFALLAGIGLETVILLAGRLVAAGMPQRPKRVNRLPRAVLLVSFSVILLTQGIWFRGLMRYVDTHAITLGAGTSGYTTPIHAILAARDAVKNAGVEDVVVVSNGMRVLFDVEPARWAVMLRDSMRCVRTLPGEGFAVFPSGKFAAVIAPNAPKSALTDLYRVRDAQTFPTRPGEGKYIVSIFDSTPDWSEAPSMPIEPVKFASGVILTGYAITPERVYLEWMLPAAGEVDYQYFTHLLDADGQAVQQRDSSFWSGRHWCAGDRLISWQSNEVTNAATLRVGFYTLDSGAAEGQYFPVDVLDVAGNPAGNWTDIALR